MACTRRHSGLSDKHTMALRNGKTLRSAEKSKRDSEELRSRKRKPPKTKRRVAASIPSLDEHACPQANQDFIPEAPAVRIRNIFERMVSGDTPWEVLTGVLHHREHWQHLVNLAKCHGNDMSMMQPGLLYEDTGMTFKELVHLHWSQCYSNIAPAPTPLRKFISSVRDVAIRTAVWDPPTHPSFYPPTARNRSELRLGFGRAFIELVNFVLLDSDSSSPDELDWFQEYLSSHSTLGSSGMDLVRRLTFPSFLYLPRWKRENLLNTCKDLESLTIGISVNNALQCQDIWRLYPVEEFVEDTFGFLPLCRLKKLILVRGGSLKFAYDGEKESVASQIPTWLEHVAAAVRRKLDNHGNCSTHVFVDHGSDWTICNESPLKEIHTVNDNLIL